jgi:hypothetical protein
MRKISLLQRLGLRGGRATCSRDFRPRVERLEGRDLLVTLFVVPGNVPTDGTHFHTLSDAIGAASTGSIIQIEPNSAPGAADGGNGTNPVNKALTIQGDPADGPPNLPQVAHLVITANGVTLTNLNLGLVNLNNGLENTTISNCLVAKVIQLPGLVFGGPTVLSGNTFTVGVSLGGDGSAGGSVGDRVVNNRFLITTGLKGGTIGLELENEVGILVQGNTFTSTVAAAYAVFGHGEDSPSIVNNTITLSGAGSVGIDVGSEPGLSALGNIRNNAIDTGGHGFGILLFKSAGSTLLSYEVDGNDLVRNGVGVAVNGDGGGIGAFGDIDLGGGDQGSPGGNDFHGYASGHSAIIVDNGGTPTTASVSARHNIFSVAPILAVQAQQGAIDVANPLDANTAFVADLYRDYLKRTGSPGEWAGWVSLLPGMGQAGVAAALIRSTEASMRRVDGLYLKVLGRTADPMGESGWAAVLHNGGTEEQVAAALLASPEFAQRANSLADSPASANVSYVDALYRLLLGRAAISAEIDFWVVQVSAVGRSAVATSFLNSVELRQDMVKALYFTDPASAALALPGLEPNLLHRPAAPPAADVAAWSNTGMDLLSIEAAIAGTAEAFANG